jgi:hypothetical protein
MNELYDKRKLRRARQNVSAQLRRYYLTLKEKYERESDALMKKLTSLLSKNEG